MPKLPKDFTRALIYKLVCLDQTIKEIYVGSTTNFNQRKRNHKKGCINPNGEQYNFNVYRFIRANGGWDNFEMVLIEYYPCNTKLELGRKENYWKNQLQASLNCHTPPMYATKKEWREEHREDIIKKQKEYRDANKEKIAERHKDYRETNRDKLKEHSKKYHQSNREQILEQRKEHYQEHREDILKKQIAYREANKAEVIARHNQKITCECGCIGNRSNMKRHKTSAKHFTMLAKQNRSGLNTQDNFCEISV